MKKYTASQTNRWLALVVAVFTIGSISRGWAFPITNPGFETDPVNDISVGGTMRYNVTGFPDFYNPLATGWTLLNPVITAFDDRTAVVQDLYGGVAGYLNHNPDGSVSTTADDNNILGLLRSNQVSQALTTTFAPNVNYELSIRSTYIKTQSAFGGGRLILGYGTASSFTILATVTNTSNSVSLDTLPDPAPGEWITILLNYTASNAGPEIGQNIVVAFAPTDAFSAASGVASYVDNFELVPEPSVAALACGGLLLLWRRRIH